MRVLIFLTVGWLGLLYTLYVPVYGSAWSVPLRSIRFPGGGWALPHAGPPGQLRPIVTRLRGHERRSDSSGRVGS
eukprot:COSAG04_NODE_298_length_17490_cov_10.214249_20_plen_75_part_00